MEEYSELKKLIENLVAKKGNNLYHFPTISDDLVSLEYHSPFQTSHGNSNAGSESQTVFVPMDGLDTTSARSDRPYIGTTALASCAGILIYDPEIKVAGVAHVFFQDKMNDDAYYEATGKCRVIDNPNPFQIFQMNAGFLVARADNIGGQKYDFKAFNIDHGVRTPEQNIQLKGIVEKTIEMLNSRDKIRSSEYRDETDFKIDTRTGLILPYY